MTGEGRGASVDSTSTGGTPVKKRREKSFVFYMLAGIVLPILAIMARYRFIDGHKIPQRGAFVLSPNHFSNIDPVITGAALWKLGRAPRFMAKASLFKVPVVGWFLRKSGQIPVERSGSSKGSNPLAAAELVVENESAVIVYPEGSLTREPNLWPMRGKTGAVRLALTHNVPIIPMAHWGTQNIMPRYSKKISFFPRKDVWIKVGDPVDLSEFAGKPLDPATLAAATDKVMVAITSLLADLRDEQAPSERWNPADHKQSETGKF